MKEYVKIINILDRSTSMNSILDSAISGINEFLDEQKELEGDAKVTTVMFGSDNNKLYENVDIKNCLHFDKNIYRTHGMTALYDAIGDTITSEIDYMGNLPKDERPSKTLCIILTDGKENRSRKYSKSKIKEMIEEMKNDFEWEFIFLAANQDASLSAESMGISSGNSYTFNATDSGTKDVFKGMSFATKMYRSASISSNVNLMDEYLKSKED